MCGQLGAVGGKGGQLRADFARALFAARLHVDRTCFGLFINCEMKGPNSVHKPARGHQRLTLPESFNLYSQGRGLRSAVVSVFIPQPTLDKVCAKRDLQRRGVFFKLVFYTFHILHVIMAKVVQGKHARPDSLSRANFPYYHLSFGLAKFVSSAAPPLLVAHFAHYLSTS